MRLGDLDYLTRWLKAVIASLPMEDHKARVAFSECLTKVNAMEEVKAAPVRHGRWIETDYFDAHKVPIYECSACFQEVADHYIKCHKYCLHCGAKMDLEKSINE